MKRSIVAVLIIVLSFCVVQVAQAGGDKLYMCSPTMENTDPNMVGVMGEKIVFFEESFRGDGYHFAVGFDAEAEPITRYFWSERSDMPDYNYVLSLKEIHDYTKFNKEDGFVFIVFDGFRRNIVRVPSRLLHRLIVQVSDDSRIVVKNFSGEPCQKSCSPLPPLALADPQNPDHVKVPTDDMLVSGVKHCSSPPAWMLGREGKIKTPQDEVLVNK